MTLKKVLYCYNDWYDYKESINNAGGLHYPYKHIGNPESYPCLVVSRWVEAGDGIGSEKYEHFFVYGTGTNPTELEEISEEDELELIGLARESIEKNNIEDDICFETGCMVTEDLFFCDDTDQTFCEKHKHSTHPPCCRRSIKTTGSDNSKETTRRYVVRGEEEKKESQRLCTKCKKLFPLSALFECEDITGIFYCAEHRHGEPVMYGQPWGCCAPATGGGENRAKETTMIDHQYSTWVCSWHCCSDEGSWYCDSSKSHFCSKHRHSHQHCCYMFCSVSGCTRRAFSLCTRKGFPNLCPIHRHPTTCCSTSTVPQHGSGPRIQRCARGCVGTTMDFYFCSKAMDLFCSHHRHIGVCCTLRNFSRYPGHAGSDRTIEGFGAGRSRYSNRTSPCGEEGCFKEGYYLCSETLQFYCYEHTHPRDADCCRYVPASYGSSSVRVIDRRDEDPWPIPPDSKELPEVHFEEIDDGQEDNDEQDPKGETEKTVGVEEEAGGGEPV